MNRDGVCEAWPALILELVRARPWGSFASPDAHLFEQQGMPPDPGGGRPELCWLCGFGQITDLLCASLHEIR